MYYKLSITETGRSTLKEEASIFNKDEQTFTTLQEVKEAIIERYGKLPKRTLANTIFIDDEEGKPKPVGFLRSFWNKDWSHNSSSWFQTDWVCVTTIEEQPVLVC